MAGPEPGVTRRTKFLLASGAVVTTAIVVAHAIMLPFVLAALLAYVLTPLVARVERRGVRRGLAVLLVYLTVLGSLGLFVRAIAPRIAAEVVALRNELPQLAERARDTWAPRVDGTLRSLGVAPSQEVGEAPAERPPAFVVRHEADGTFSVDVGSGVNVVETKNGFVIEPVRSRKASPLDVDHVAADIANRTLSYAEQNAMEIARGVRSIVSTVAQLIFLFFITLMVAAYMILTRERIVGFFRSLARGPARLSFDALLKRIDAGLSGVVRGQLLICGINGALSAVGFAIIGLKYWPVMALMAAMFSLVPVFGSIASSVPAVAIGLTQGLSTAALVLLWIVGIHQLEAHFLNPKIMGDTAKIHPVLVIFSLLVGEHFFHVAGALLAVPAMSVAQTLFLHFSQATDEAAGATEGAELAPSPGTGKAQ